jgi:hypothetical protein
MAEILSGFASTAVNGEHLWLGIIYTNMTHQLKEQGLDFPLTSYKPCPRSNKWKQTVLNIITPLFEAAKEMWSIKETARREAFLREPTMEERIIQAKRKRRRADIRSWFTRVSDKVGSIRKRLTKGKAPSLPDSRTPPIQQQTTRWKNTVIQEYFRLNRDHSRKMIQSISSKPVFFPRSLLVNLKDTGDLDWLPIKQDESEIEQTVMEGVNAAADDTGDTATAAAITSRSNSIECFFKNTSATYISTHNHINNNSINYINRKEFERSKSLSGRSGGKTRSNDRMRMRNGCKEGGIPNRSDGSCNKTSPRNSILDSMLGNRVCSDSSSSNVAEDDASKRKGVG